MTRGFQDFPKINYDNKSYVCWCGKKTHFLDVTTNGGYHPEIGRNLYFAFSNRCHHNAPISTQQFIYLNLDSLDALTQHSRESKKMEV